MENLSWTKSGNHYLMASTSQEFVKLQFQTTGESTFWMNEERYKVKKSGFWNQRYTVYTDNKEVLTLTHNFWGSKGTIHFSDGTQYQSDYAHKNILTLLFLDQHTEILRYSVDSKNGKHQAVLNLGLALVDADRLLLLATLGMVIFLNIFNEFNDSGGEADAFFMVSAA